MTSAAPTGCDSPAQYLAEATCRADNIYGVLRVVACMWLLGCYLVPNTFPRRISPGSVLLDDAGLRGSHLAGPSVALLFLLALLLLMHTVKGASLPKCLPLWLLTAVFAAPLVAVCAFTRNAPDMLGPASVLAAISVGIVVARIGGMRIAAVLTMAASVQALYTVLYQRAGINLMLSGSVHRAGGTFNNPNDLYTLMLTALPFAVAGALEAKQTLAQFWYLAAASAEAAALILSGSRGGIIAAGFAALLMAIMAKVPRRYILAIALILAALCIAISLVRSAGPTNAVSVEGSNRSRMREWKAGWNDFVRHPLIGVGVCNYAQQVTTEHGHVSTIHVAEDPKNIPLFWLAERGIIGGILFALFLWSVVGAIRGTPHTLYSAGVAAAWFGLLLAGMVDTPFGPASRYVGNCCFGLLIGVTALLPMSKTIASPDAIAGAATLMSTTQGES